MADTVQLKVMYFAGNIYITQSLKMALPINNYFIKLQFLSFCFNSLPFAMRRVLF